MPELEQVGSPHPYSIRIQRSTRDYDPTHAKQHWFARLVLRNSFSTAYAFAPGLPAVALFSGIYLGMTSISEDVGLQMTFLGVSASESLLPVLLFLFPSASSPILLVLRTSTQATPLRTTRRSRGHRGGDNCDEERNQSQVLGAEACALACRNRGLDDGGSGERLCRRYGSRLYPPRLSRAGTERVSHAIAHVVNCASLALLSLPLVLCRDQRFEPAPSQNHADEIGLRGHLLHAPLLLDNPFDSGLYVLHFNCTGSREPSRLHGMCLPRDHTSAQGALL